VCLVTVCYLERFRTQQVRWPELPEKPKTWWRAQRSYGLSRVVLQSAEEHGLAKLLGWSGTKSGLRQLRRSLRQALLKEYREAGYNPDNRVTPAQNNAASKLALWVCVTVLLGELINSKRVG